MNENTVAAGFVRSGGDVLLLQRSQHVCAPEIWEPVTIQGGETARAIRVEIHEKTGIDPDRCELARTGTPLFLEDEHRDRRWQVHPYLFDCPAQSVTLDREHITSEWVPPTAIRRWETVPNLWEAYNAVRPTVATIRDDHEHGSAYISLRALDVLRDEATLTAAGESEFDSIEAVGTALFEARPAMTVVTNRVNRAMQARADGPTAVATAVQEQLERAETADERAAQHLADRITGDRVGTLSRSGTVLQAVARAEPDAVLLAESRPGREGIDVAEHLAPDMHVTLTSDAAFPHQLTAWGADVFVTGADAILPDGTVRNKVGTRAAATVATRANIPVLVVAGVDKISPTHTTATEPRPAEELYAGDAELALENPTFDQTPPGEIDTVVTERGTLDIETVRQFAREFEALAAWQAESLSDE